MPGDQSFLVFRRWAQEIPGWGVLDAPDSAPLIMLELEPMDEATLLANTPSDDPIWKYSSLMIQRYGAKVITLD